MLWRRQQRSKLPINSRAGTRLALRSHTVSATYFKSVFELCCHSCREKKQGSPWRDRPIAENLKLFEDMRRGLVDEGKMTLRYFGVYNTCSQKLNHLC